MFHIWPMDFWLAIDDIKSVSNMFAWSTVAPRPDARPVRNQMVIIWGSLEAHSRTHCRKMYKIVNIYVIYCCYIHLYTVYRIPSYTSNYLTYLNIRLQETRESLLKRSEKKRFVDSWPSLHESILSCQAVLSGIKLLLTNPKFPWEIPMVS